jgi:hypothetical protein
METQLMTGNSRIIFNGVTIISLLSCVAVSAVWVRSRFWVDEFYRPTATHYFDVSSERGLLIFFCRLCES